MVPFTRAGMSSLLYPTAPSPSSTCRSNRNWRSVSARTAPASSLFTCRMSAPEGITESLLPYLNASQRDVFNVLCKTYCSIVPHRGLYCIITCCKVNRYRGSLQPLGGALDTSGLWSWRQLETWGPLRDREAEDTHTHTFVFEYLWGPSLTQCIPLLWTQP